MLLESATSFQIELETRQRFSDIATREQMYALQPREFEFYVGYLYERRGYQVLITQASVDGGYDLIVRRMEPLSWHNFWRRRDVESKLVECKRYRNTVGIDTVREFMGALQDTEFDHGILVTQSRFSPPARDYETRNPVELVNGETLERWAREIQRRNRPNRIPTFQRIEIPPALIGCAGRTFAILTTGYAFALIVFSLFVALFCSEVQCFTRRTLAGTPDTTPVILPTPQPVSPEDVMLGGVVYIGGLPATDATVTISKDGLSASTTVDSLNGTYEFDGTTILNNMLNASYGDEVTLTVTHSGDPYSYTVRANADPFVGSQRVDLPVPTGTGTDPVAEVNESKVESNGRELEFVFDGEGSSADVIMGEWSINGEVIATGFTGSIYHYVLEPQRQDVAFRVQDRFGNWSAPVTQQMDSSCLTRIEGAPQEYVSIQGAIDLANAGDTVQVAGLCQGVQERDEIPGYPFRVVPTQVALITKTLTLEGGYDANDWGAGSNQELTPTVIDAHGQGRGIAVLGNHTFVPPTVATVRNLHVTNGNATDLFGVDTDDNGGGVYMTIATLDMENVEISNSVASTIPGRGSGAGIAVFEGYRVYLSDLHVHDNEANLGAGGGSVGATTGFLHDSVFENNTADERGGGFLVGYSLDFDIVGNTFRNNTVTSTSGGQGGGVWLIANDGGTFERNIITDNQAGRTGGGVAVTCDDYTTIENNIIADNDLIRRNSTGAGIAFIAAFNDVFHNTIANNTDGAGVLVTATMPGVGCSGPADVVATNNIVSGHSVGIETDDMSDITITSTLWWGNTIDAIGMVNETGSVNGDPAYASPATRDYHILAETSAAVDAAIDAGVRVDIDLQDRPQGGGYDIGADEAPPRSYTHRLMFYFAADNNLSGTLSDVIAELQSVATEDVAVVVLYDGNFRNDSALIEVSPTGTQTYTPPWMLSEINTGDPEILTAFVNWSRVNFPADHVYFTISSHGGGVNGIAPDERTNDYLEPAEMTASAADWIEAVDILHFDACSMGMSEVAYAFRDKAEYMVAASSLAWGIFAYDDYYAAGFEQRTTLDQAVAIADLYHSHPELSNRSRNIAVFDMAELDGLDDVVRDLSIALRAGDFSAELATIIAQVQRFDSEAYYVIDSNDEFIDLYHFAELVEQEIDNAVVDAAAQAVQQYLQGVTPRTPPLIKYANQTTVPTDWDLSNSYGIGIFYPSSPESIGFGRYYHVADWAFSSASQWNDLLTAYNGVPEIPLSGDGFQFGETLPPPVMPTAVQLAGNSAASASPPLLLLLFLLCSTTFILRRR